MGKEYGQALLPVTWLNPHIYLQKVNAVWKYGLTHRLPSLFPVVASPRGRGVHLKNAQTFLSAHWAVTAASERPGHMGSYNV